MHFDCPAACPSAVSINNNDNQKKKKDCTNASRNESAMNILRTQYTVHANTHTQTRVATLYTQATVTHSPSNAGVRVSVERGKVENYNVKIKPQQQQRPLQRKLLRKHTKKDRTFCRFCFSFFFSYSYAQRKSSSSGGDVRALCENSTVRIPSSFRG